MNSLSILSSQVERVIGTTPPASPRSESSFKRNNLNRSSASLSTSALDLNQAQFAESDQVESEQSDDATSPQRESKGGHEQEDGEEDVDEVTTPLLNNDNKLEEQNIVIYQSVYQIRLNRFISILRAPLKWLWSSIIFSTSYLTSCFYNDEKRFSPLLPLYRISTILLRPFGTRDSNDTLDTSYHIAEESQVFSIDDDIEKTFNEEDNSYSKSRPILLSQYSQSKATLKQNDSNSFTTQPRIPLTSEEDTAPRRSVRIRLFNQENLQQKSRSLKSPTSPSSSLRLTRYPRNVGPPRPLLHKSPSPKTLILDLDETLIHSISKGPRMSSGHMVEVKLDRQHAILYYVHKRPFCDEFLRKVCKWYNVVIFTASVQEYADPVIDWLDSDNTLFKERFYRQHCTFREGVYVKDITLVEPDLSKVMIVDNSPSSYLFHKDNAIPIEGWISDPTDHDLLHLVPLLQGLQYVTDVRAFLALRMGEASP